MKNQCKGPECDREAVYKGLCIAHYKQDRDKGVLTPLRPYHRKLEAPEGYSYCNECRNFKPLSEFYLTPAGKPRHLCRTCHYKKAEARRKAKA
jgi:hypothetical protein